MNEPTPSELASTAYRAATSQLGLAVLFAVLAATRVHLMDSTPTNFVLIGLPVIAGFSIATICVAFAGGLIALAGIYASAADDELD